MKTQTDIIAMYIAISSTYQTVLQLFLNVIRVFRRVYPDSEWDRDNREGVRVLKYNTQRMFYWLIHYHTYSDVTDETDLSQTFDT